MKIFENVYELIGRTPLIDVSRVSPSAETRIIGKLETMNPMSSLKDRSVMAMVAAAEKEGQINSRTVLIEPTSGNTGVALAYICAAKGYSLMLTMPDTVPIEQRNLLQRFGTKIILTPGVEGMPGAVRKAAEIAGSNSRYFLLRQFENPANSEAHRDTAAEIWDDTAGQVDIFVTGVGSGGTISGVAETLKKKKPGLKVAAVEPAGSPVLSGGEPGEHYIFGIGAGFVPQLFRPELIDEIITVSDEDAAEMSKKLAQELGILVGFSAGANVSAACKIAERAENKDKMIVTMLCDSGERYLSYWF